MAGLARLDSKVALITGASSGIGAMTAVLFAELGAHLVLTGRKQDNLQKTGAQCEAASKQKLLKPVLIRADLTKDEDVKRVVDEAVTAKGRLDILVNSAGIQETGSIETTSLDQFDRVFNINTRSIYHLAMLCAPHLIKTKGNIVNVSSINGNRSFPNMLIYCMTKSAVDMMTKCVALDLAPKQVRVNSVNPGVIVTELHKRAGMSEEQYSQFLERCKTTHALGRAGNAQEVANTIAFLASDSASFLTGTNIPVDGGRQAMCPR